MQIGHDEIHQVVQGVWNAILGRDIDVASGDFNGQAPDLRTASIQITGEWEGVVVCKSSEPLIREVAGVMFAKDHQALTPDLLDDAFGELTNMIAGNLKGLLPGPCYLSLPVLGEPSNGSSNGQNAQPVAQSVFMSQGHPLVVELMEADRLHAGSSTASCNSVG
jgi:hypothetical protein